MRRDDLLSEIRVRVPEILAQQKVRWERGGRSLKLSWNGHHARFDLLLLPQPGLAGLKELALSVGNPARSSHGSLIVAPYLGEEARQVCREHGIPYLDLSGNVWIARGPLLIEKEVPRSRYVREAAHRSPFADRANLVLRFLLDRAGIAAGVREIAVAVDVSPGYVSKILREAEEARYVEREPDGRFKIKNPREVLGDWRAFYQWRKNDLDSFFLAQGKAVSIEGALRDALRSADNYALSLHAGNNQIEPFAQSDVWHLYLNSDAAARRLKERLPLKPVERDAGNVVFMRPYYRVSAFYGVRDAKGLRVVSDLQLYLDLQHYPIRGAEAADHILRRRLARAWRLEGDRAHV